MRHLSIREASTRAPGIFSPVLNRRDVLQAAAALGLSFAMPALDASAAKQRGSERKKSLITIWLEGGPSQLETWDPHPGPISGGQTQAISTRIPELQIAEFYPRMAEEIDCLSVIRSMVSKEGDHERGSYYLKTGYRPDPTLVHPSLGSIFTRELPDPSLEIPSHVSLCGGKWPPRGGFLGDDYDAFKIYEPGRNLRNMKAQVADQRQSRRLEGLEVVSRAFHQSRGALADRTLHQETVERALKMMTSDQLKAFDLDNEPAAAQKAYGDTQFGRGCLVARRLVEQGVRAVEIALVGFDSHANNFEAHKTNGAILDPALASLLRDLRERDLFDSTVVLCIGEFGRTPQINKLAGRDHWPTGFSCLIGGGLRRGVVIGKTDPDGKKKDPFDPIEVRDLYATLFRVAGIDYAKQNITPIGRPMAYSDGKPIERLL